MIAELFQKGITQFRWWPDWRDDVVVILACGPSANSIQLNDLEGKVKVLAIKQAVSICPWASAVYGCDSPWWIYRNGLPEFNGLKFCYDGRACNQFPTLIRVMIDNPAGDRMQFEKPLHVGAGGNSGFQALNLAVQFGARKIALVGYDMSDRAGRSHWYGRNGWTGANNPDANNFRRWKMAFEKSVIDLKAVGVDVVNLSSNSDLQCFPKASIEEAMERFAA